MNALDGISIAVLLTLVGCVLVIAEVFFASGGVIGLLATAAFGGAIYSAYTAGGLVSGLGFALGEALLLPVLLYAAFRMLPYTPMGKLLVGSAPQPEDLLPADNRGELVGKIGVARSKMLPAGAVDVEGRVLDAVSQGQAIEPGEYVRVVEASRTRVVVRRVTAADDPRSAEAAGDPLDRPAADLGIESFEFDGPGGDPRGA